MSKETPKTLICLTLTGTVQYLATRELSPKERNEELSIQEFDNALFFYACSRGYLMDLDASIRGEWATAKTRPDYLGRSRTFTLPEIERLHKLLCQAILKAENENRVTWHYKGDARIPGEFATWKMLNELLVHNGLNPVSENIRDARAGRNGYRPREALTRIIRANPGAGICCIT